MEQKILEDVLRYLSPHMKYIMNIILGQKQKEIESLKERIEQGLISGKVDFSQELKIDLKALESEKGKEWVEVLKKQLKILTQMSERFKK